MILIGELSLWVALLMATWAAPVSFAGGLHGRGDLVASGERGIYAAFAMLTLAASGLWAALITNDLSFLHVALFTSANVPRVYTLSAFWGGPAGALLLWAWLLAGCAAVAVRANSRSGWPLAPYATGTLAVALGFALAALCLGANPYERIEWSQLDGRGMSPVLQNAGMIFHPPALFLGLAATAVPFALAIAALVSRQVDGEWTAAARRWVIVSWLFLTIGLVLGMWWAYAEPVVEGHWARDAVGNAAAFPWLVNTVLLHSLRNPESRRARSVNVILLLSAFLLSVFSAFLARGGIVSVARSFAQSEVVNWLAVFLLIATAAATYLLLARVPRAGWEAASGSEGASWWTGLNRGARGAGLRVVHAGMAVMLVALAAQAFATSYRGTLRAGESAPLRDPFGREWRVTSQGVSQYNELNRRVVAASLDLSRAGRTAAIVTSERRQYVDSRGTDSFAPSTEPGLHRTLLQDVQIALIAAESDERVQLRVAFNPLVIWVWIAGALMAVGGVLLLAQSGARAEA